MRTMFFCYHSAISGLMRVGTSSLAFLVAGVLFAPRSSAVDILATAAPGTPYGVATIEIPIVAPIVGQSTSAAGSS